MNRIDDERIQFYLRHQQRIDEWAAIAGEARGAANEFLKSCQSDVGSLAQELGADVLPSLAEPYSKLFLCHPAWFPNSGDRAFPRAGIGLEWHRPKVTFANAATCAYVGLWVHNDIFEGKELHKDISNAIHKAGLVKKYQLTSSSSWWPVYRREPAQGEFWSDLTPYRNQLMDSIRFFWETFEPVVQKLIGK